MTVEQQDSNLDLKQLLLVLRAIQEGDFAPRMEAGGSGLGAEIAATVNAIQTQNQLFAAGVSRLRHEIGHKGRLGGQAELPNASGHWKDMTDSINFVAGQTAFQVRDMTRAFVAANGGNAAAKVTMPGEGEFALLRDALNTHLEHDRK